VSLRLAGAALAVSLALSGGAPAQAARELSLRECIDIAITGNPDIGVARQRLKKSESDVMARYGSLLPDLSVDFYAGHRYYGPSSVLIDEQGRPVQSEGFDYEDYTLRVGSNIVLWDGGGNYARLSQAKHTRDGAREEFEYNSDMITATVIRSYYNLVRTRMLATVAEESVESARQNLERTEALLEVGSATRADVLKAKVRHSNTKLDLIRAQNQVELARTDLTAVLNMPGEEIDVDTTLVIEFVQPDLRSEIDFALENRSELRGLEHYRESAKSGISAARSGWLPTFGASFGYYWSDRSMANNLNFFKEEYQWNITGFMSVNLFDRFQTGTNVKRARADLRIAEYELERYQLAAMKEVKNLVLMIDEARERIVVATETVEQAQEDVRLAEERYRVGAGTMLDTISALVTLTQAKADVIDAKCDYLIAVADLERATGRESKYRAGH
jgi:outer membrane protein TolC